MKNTDKKLAILLDDLYDIAVELDSREFSNNCLIDRLTGLSWDELCDKGIEIHIFSIPGNTTHKAE